MDSNTHSIRPEPSEPPELQKPLELPALPDPPGSLDPLEDLPLVLPEDLVELTAALDKVSALDLDGRPAAVRAQRVLALQQLASRLEGQWLRELAGVDALGAAGADEGVQAPSTAGWLRRRLRMGAGAAHDAVRTARAVFRGPLTGTAQALSSGQLSPAHARVLANGTRHLPDQVAREAEPVLLEAARRLDPPLLRQAVGYLVEVADPEGAEVASQRRHDRRGLWLAATLDDMVAVNGFLEPEAGSILRAALEPLARPADADDDRNADQRTADALAELCRRSLEGGWLPTAGGVRPQLQVTADLETLVGGPGGLGGDTGWGPLEGEACRRLACDGAVTRVLVSRQPSGPDGGIDHGSGPDHEPGRNLDPDAAQGLQARLRAAMALLPPTLGGAPSRPLDVGRATRVVQPAQRSALAVRDRGCVFPGCDRPLAWCDAHHLWHWIDGGPTDLGNLALLCRAHHRAVHEGGWQLTRGPDGCFTASPGSPPHHRHRRRGVPTPA